MTITVSGPGNVTVQFPDGTDAAVINDVMTKNFGGGAAAAKPSSPIATGDLARAAARGVPILGGLTNRGVAAAEAGFGHGTYAQNLKDEDAREAKFEAEHPYANAAAGLVGGVASTGGLGATATGARLLGLGGRTLLGQIGRGAASGAAINAADALVRGNDPGVAAVAGGGIGAAVPPAARLVGGALAPVVQTARGIVNPTGEAAQRVGAAVAHDVQAGGAGLAQPEFQRLQAQGVPVNMMDLGGETTRALARSAANTSPEGRQVLNQAINDRFESQVPRTVDWLNSGLNFGSPQARDQAIRDVQQNVYEPLYARAYAGKAKTLLWPDNDIINARAAAGTPFNAQEIGALQSLKELTGAPEVQDAIRRAQPVLRSWAVRDGLKPPAPAFGIDNSGPTPKTVLTQTASGSTNLPSLQLWDYVKRSLDRMGTPQASFFSRELRNNLDVLVPEYQQARAAAHPVKFFNGAGNAYEAGQNYVNNGIKFGDDAAAHLASMQPEERGLFQDGYTTALAERLLNTPDRRSILNRINNTPAARQEVERAIGSQRYNQLEARLRVEGVMEDARHAVQGNSTTARQLAELGLAGGGSMVLGGGNPLSGDPAALMNAALMYGAIRGGRALGTTVDERVSRRVAQLLTSNNPQQIQMAMQMITRNQGLMNALRAAHGGLARAAAVQAQPALALPAP